MNKQYLIIGVTALILIGMLSGTYFILFNQSQYKNITMNGITVEVPESNVSVIQQTNAFSIYNDTEHSVDVLVYDSTDIGLNDLTEAMTFAAVRDMFQVGSTLQTTEGYSYNYSDTNKVYTYVTNYTHKNLFIVTANKEDMIHALQTIKVNDEINLNITNETNQTVTKANNNKNTKSDDDKEELREDEKVIDGWDPKEHEVSRESMEDGYEKVHYDDGYFRIVDDKGKIQSYGY
ncbi:MAG: hypothetical protein E7Z85_07570 [Methanosphaera stadtmanae]|nr:hypothetical protein [Methanosphaera stadtmanae]